MEAHRRLKCIRVPQSLVFVDASNTGLKPSQSSNETLCPDIWWPCLIFDNYRQLISTIPCDMSTERAHVFLESIKHSKTCSVAALIGSWKYGSMSKTVPLPDNEPENSTNESITDFYFWYIDKFQNEESNRNAAYFDKLEEAVQKAINMLQESIPSNTETLCQHESGKGGSVFTPSSILSNTETLVQHESDKGDSALSNARRNDDNTIAEESPLNKRGDLYVYPTPVIPVQKLRRVSMSKEKPPSSKKQKLIFKNEAKNHLAPPKSSRSTNSPRLWQHGPGRKKKLVVSSSSVPVDELPWNHLWGMLVHFGWRHERARNPLHDWYYIPPKNQAVFIGKDFFHTPHDVMMYIRENEQVKNYFEEKRRFAFLIHEKKKGTGVNQEKPKFDNTSNLPKDPPIQRPKRRKKPNQLIGEISTITTQLPSKISRSSAGKQLVSSSKASSAKSNSNSTVSPKPSKRQNLPKVPQRELSEPNCKKSSNSS